MQAHPGGLGIRRQDLTESDSKAEPVPADPGGIRSQTSLSQTSRSQTSLIQT